MRSPARARTPKVSNLKTYACVVKLKLKNFLLAFFSADGFKGEAAVPLNLNRATSVELESIGGFLRRESAAWMAYRGKRPCTTLEDLKAVPGVDFKKVEKRRDRLVCF